MWGNSNPLITGVLDRGADTKTSRLSVIVVDRSIEISWVITRSTGILISPLLHHIIGMFSRSLPCRFSPYLPLMSYKLLPTGVCVSNKTLCSLSYRLVLFLLSSLAAVWLPITIPAQVVFILWEKSLWSETDDITCMPIREHPSPDVQAPWRFTEFLVSPSLPTGFKMQHEAGTSSSAEYGQGYCEAVEALREREYPLLKGVW